MPVNNPLSKVNKMYLSKDKKTISLEVGLDGFTLDAPIEISGQATQTNGAIASFYSIQTVPSPNSAGETVVSVKSVSVVDPDKFAFDPASPITVVSRAAEVWLTTLVNAGVAQPHDSAVAAEFAAQSAGYAVSEPGKKPPAGWP
jgi:hypothetical protein